MVVLLVVFHKDLPGTSYDLVPARVKNERIIDKEDNEEEEMEVESGDHSPLPKMESNGSPPGKAISQTVNNAISQSSESSQNAQQAPKQRTPCMYADHCYR